eukprot:TRINITY_DN1835_c0_g1_i1.p1 TRINITY_DN1835_c0_g1~~TRINITY_DN1835_c0_g1_i1.p1  ORF type:complete len:1716 (-),score=684.24 TRINITY_DN1835_c0_g1_i1:112-5259(-)
MRAVSGHHEEETRRLDMRLEDSSRLNREAYSGAMNPPAPLTNTRPTSYRREASIPPPPNHSRSNPRQLRIERKDNGFGFTLRHFIVYPPEEGSEAGPPIQEPMDTIFVKSVKDQGPAVVAGLNIGDRIVSVNGETVSGRSYAQVVQMIQKSRDSLFLVVVPRQDDVLQVYFSEIAQNPESNRRLEASAGAGTAPAKPPWPASVCSSSSRESSPFSSKTSDSTRDSVYGHNKDYFSGSFRKEPPATQGLYPSSGGRRHPAPPEPENIYDTIGPASTRKGDRLSQFLTSSTLTVPPTSHSNSSEHMYAAIPALATSSMSSSSTLASGTSQVTQSRDSLDSDSSVMAGFTSRQEERVIDKIKKDCERKEEFLRNPIYPAYLSSPPKDIDQSPYGIASLASTMPPPVIKEPPPPVEVIPEPPKPAKNFFMDIYAQEVSKMQTVSKTSAPTKKRNFDATQFNAYGLPLGYRKGNTYDNIDSFSRNNYVIVGSRTLHCEPPQVYQPTPEPPPDDEEEKNLRRISYLQATKEERMDVEDNLTNESGLAPTHSIKKLKSIFSEKTEPATSALPPPPPSPGLSEPPVPAKLEHSISPVVEQENIREGYLTCKVAVVDGKKANDRSWKTVYAVLKCKALYMFKDKKMALDNLEYEEKPVKLMESEVEVASDYTKRKNVFRVKTDAGSEYLFQAENEGMMKDWVSAIDETAMAIIVDERKDSNKLRKLTSFRNRSPTGQSPASKSRKSSAELVPPFKEKDKKTWKGKMVKQLKKIGGGSHGPLYPEGGSIGVPMEECPLCETEFIPYLVKVCCDIVNERGLDIVGIYRVPGNNAAVTYLTEQVNKGVENFALEDQRWQDVNVVSSLLKSFFRKLPDPLFTVEMYSLFIEASKIDMAPRRMDQLRKLVRELPEIHLETLKYLTSHLCQVADHATINKMEVRNLAIVFGPTLVRTTDDNMVSMVTDMSQQCRIIESLLSNWEYFFTEEEVEVKEEAEDSQQPLGTGVSNQSLMLANLHKLEDAGKVGSPKGDVSAKDIVTSIISAANRKMLRAATKGKKESSVECESERGASMSRDRVEEGGRHDRRESEAVIHGALQIASAVPGLLGGDDRERDGETPEPELPHGYSRQNSRGSLSMGRRGSGSVPPHCLSKRGSICAYSGGQVCEVTPVGEVCETRIAMMNSDTEMVSNGLGEHQEVVTGKLSLVNVPGYPRVSPGLEQITDHSSSMSCMVSNTLGVASSVVRPDSAPPLSEPPAAGYKFPIETYAGLDQATAERIAKFEAETKAMLTQRSGLARSSQDLHEVVSTTHHHRHGVSSSPTRSLTSVSTSSPSQTSLRTGSICSLLSSGQDTSMPLSSLTTPVPDSNPLDGGILMEEPYSTEAYNTPLGSQRRFLHLTYRTSLPNLQPDQDKVENILAGFDTKKVAAKGTLQRMKVRGRPELHSLGLEMGGAGRQCETVWDCEAEGASPETEKLLTNLTASFDQKMRLLLDPHYQSSSSVTSSSSEGQVKVVLGDMAEDTMEEMMVETLSPVTRAINKKQLDEARNILQQVKSGKRVELRRSGRVDKSLEPEKRQERRLRSEPGTVGQQVLRQVNTKRQLNRSDSLTKQEKTEMNLRAKAGEKENTVASLREQFEGKREGQQSRGHRIDVTKLRKKLSDCNNRRIKRRHTVGGTKDFSENVVSLIVRGVSAWDRLAPIISDQESEERRLSLQVEEERRFSLPPVESTV